MFFNNNNRSCKLITFTVLLKSYIFAKSSPKDIPLFKIKFTIFFICSLFYFIPLVKLFHFNLPIISNDSLSILENPNHFLPKSFSDAPMWYISFSSIMRNLSCEELNFFISMLLYWKLYFSRSSFSYFDIVLV